MDELIFLKGNKANLPSNLENNTVYVATSETASDSEIIIDGIHWVSKAYIDNELQKIWNKINS